MAEKYVRLVQDMYEGGETVVRCAVGTTESFKVKALNLETAPWISVKSVPACSDYG